MWRQQCNNTAASAALIHCSCWALALVQFTNVKGFPLLSTKLKCVTYVTWYLAIMGKPCVVGGCSNSNTDKVSVHLYPKDPTLRQKWDTFVKSTRKDWKGGNDNSIICGVHFKAPDDFCWLGYVWSWFQKATVSCTWCYSICHWQCIASHI